MNRNAAIAVVLVGVLLAALSVGVSTFMSNRDLQETTDAMRAEVGDSADAVATELDTKLQGVSELAAAALPSENGLATGLTSKGLFAAGVLSVSPAPGETPIFSVDTGESTVNSAFGLNVAEKSTMGDIDAGLIDATGLVAGSLETKSGAWAVDAGGTVKQRGDLTVGGNAEIGGNLNVKGGSFNIGRGLIYSESFDWATSALASQNLPELRKKIDKSPVLEVDGYVIADGFTSSTGKGFTFADSVIFEQDLWHSSKSWEILKSGQARFVTVFAGALNDSSKTWWVTDTGEGHFNKIISGALTSGSADITGEMHAASASIDGTLTVGGQQIGPGGVDASDKTVTARHFIAKQSFSLDNGNFEVDSAGNGDFAGKLTANEFESVSTDFRVSSAGAMTVGSATVNGDLDVNGDIYGNFRGTIDDTTTWNKNNLSVSNLTASNSIRLDSGSVVFSVASNGNTSVGGTLAVAGNASVGGNLNVTGDASVTGNMGVTGNITAANLRNMAAGSVVVTAGSSVSQAVAGITAAGGVVVATPADTAVSPYRAWASNGSITIENLSGTDATFNWVAMW